MAILKIDANTQQRLAVAVPIVALALSLFVVYPAWGKHGELGTLIETKQAELDKLKAIVVPPAGSLLPAAEASRSEPSDYIGLLSALAAAAQVRVLGIDTEAPDKAKSAGSVQVAKSKIEIEGGYRQIRSFLWQVSHSTRILVITDLTTTAPGAANTMAAAPIQVGLGQKATIGIERYIAPPQPPK